MKIIFRLFSSVPSFLLLVFFGAFSLGQLQRFQLSNNAAVYAHDAAGALLLVWYIFASKKIPVILKKIPVFFEKIKKEYRTELILVVWALGSTLAGTLAGTVNTRSWLYITRLVFYILFIIVVRATSKKTVYLRTALALSGSLMAVWGIIQYLWFPDTRLLSIFGWDNHYYRLIGTLFDPAFMGMMLVLTFGWWQFPDVLPALPRRWKQGIQLCISVALAATFSRASYAAFGVFLFLQWRTRALRWTSAALIGLVFVTTILILPKPGGEGVNLARTSTGQARLMNARENLITLQGTQWLWGRGLFNTDAQQTYATPSHAQLPDSLPILVLNATGLGGSALTLFVLFKWLRRWQEHNPVWTHLFLAVLVHSLFNNTFFQPFIFLALWLGF